MKIVFIDFIIYLVRLLLQRNLNIFRFNKVWSLLINHTINLFLAHFLKKNTLLSSLCLPICPSGFCARTHSHYITSKFLDYTIVKNNNCLRYLQKKMSLDHPLISSINWKCQVMFSNILSWMCWNLAEIFTKTIEAQKGHIFVENSVPTYENL